jgi:hypothetical protein
VSLGKLREYHGHFKNICGNFSIDNEEFNLIFQLSNNSYFKIWDIVDNGIIDALELFSGLILYSDSKVDEKIRCNQTLTAVLFELFDFNELNSLSPYDIEHLVQRSLSSSLKIFGVTKKLDQPEVSRLIDSYFFSDARINISQLLK